MAMTSGISYPPTMPLYADRVRHTRINEGMWAAPIPFIPFLFLTTFVFLVGLGVLFAVQKGWTIGELPRAVTFWIAALLPAVVLMLVILLSPKSTSPIFAYQLELFRKPDDVRMRWNLAVVSTANVYCGATAQSEWLYLLPNLSEKDRFRALDYIRLVGRRLQRFPFCTASEVFAMMGAALAVGVISVGVFHNTPIESIFHSIEVMVVLQLFLLYLYMQRWQHRRRLDELEEIFEELLPLKRPTAESAPEDEVETWFREQAKPATPPKPEEPQLPRAPWE